MIRIIIDETGRNNLKEKPYYFNQLTEDCKNNDEVKLFLQERYGKIPKGRNKIYVDTKDGISKEIGILHSYWNYEKIFQTDWITFLHIIETPIKYKNILKG